jgi:hypothetical protein
MKRIKIVGLCLVAAMAMAAFASSSASAFEYKVCFKVKVKHSGKFNDKLCSIPGKEGGTGLKENEYEKNGNFEKLVKKTFTGKNGVSTLDSYAPESETEPWTGGTVLGKVTCKKAKSAGEITGAKTSTVTVTFETCTSETKKCTSANQAVIGDIKTNLLAATIVSVGGKPASNVAPAKGTSAEFSCEGLEISTVGSINGLITGNIEGKYSLSSVQTFKVNAKGGQENPFTDEEPSSPKFLLSTITPPGATLPSGENTTSTLKGSSATEIS